MNKYFKLFLSLVALAIFTFCNSQNVSQKETDINSTIDSLYFGYKSPGRKATIFAPELLTFECHDSPIISHDETWMVIGTIEKGVLFYKMNNGKLSLTTNPLKFDIPEINNYNGMAFSVSENRIYFLVWKNNDENFYFIEKNENGWTAPKLLGDEINSFRTHWQFSIDMNENLYFASENQILVSVFDGNTHLKPVPLKLEYDGKLSGSTPFIAPDESYIIFSMDGNLHISYNLNNGKWTTPQNLGSNINSENLDNCPRISPNGKYLFFVSRRINRDFVIYWADAGFIEEFKPKNLIKKE